MRTMRRACAALVLCAAAGGCHFDVIGIDVDGSGAEVDLSSGVDGAEPPVDMAGCLCATGCSTSTTTCLTLQPSGPVTVADYTQPGLLAPIVTSTIVVDTDSGQVSGGLPRPPGTGVIAGVGFRVATQASGP